MACGNGILVMGERLFKFERLTGTEWQQERGTTKMRRRRCRRSETSKSHPKWHPECREAKRRVGFVWLVLWTVGVFLQCPLHLFSTERGEDCRAETQAKTPTHTAILRPCLPKGFTKVGG